MLNDKSDKNKYLSDDFEEFEEIDVKIIKPSKVCEKCKNSRIRKRIIDLPILDGLVVLTGVKVLYCVDCKRSTIRPEFLDELKKRIDNLGISIDENMFHNLINEGLVIYDKSWAEKEQGRKNFTFYFPSKEDGPKKAQISLQFIDPLYPILRSLDSEELRKSLNLDNYEELQMRAEAESRPISQYLKVELAKRFLEDRPSGGLVENNDGQDRGVNLKVITIVPQKVDLAQLEETKSEFLSLAAKSEETKEIVLLQSREFEGVLNYDYEYARLYITVKKNKTGFNKCDVEYKVDNKLFTEHDLVVHDNKILFNNKTKHTDDDVNEMVMKFKR